MIWCRNAVGVGSTSAHGKGYGCSTSTGRHRAESRVSAAAVMVAAPGPTCAKVTGAVTAFEAMARIAGTGSAQPRSTARLAQPVRSTFSAVARVTEKPVTQASARFTRALDGAYALSRISWSDR